MRGKWVSVGMLAAVASALLAASGCAHDQQLVSIQVRPPVQTDGATNIPVSANAGSQVQLRGSGTYIHPPVTKDITDPVTWASNDTQMFTVNSTGLLTATGACGSALVSATATTNTSPGGISRSGAIVTGYMTANVVSFEGGGTGTGPTPTLTFAGTGARSRSRPTQP